MATSLGEIKRFLDGDGLKYKSFDEDNVITVGFQCEPEETTFRDKAGDPHLGILIRVTENGEYLQVIAPSCWSIPNPSNRGSACEALALISARFKMIRWDLDDDEIRPNVEIPLEDSALTQKQLRRAIGAILQVVREYDRVVTRAIRTGEVSFRDVAKETRPAPATIEDAIRRIGGEARARRLLGGEP